MNDWRDPIHPDEILKDELEEIGLNGAALANTPYKPDIPLQPSLNR